MPGLVPGIHVFETVAGRKTWMAGTSPAMTGLNQRVANEAFVEIRHRCLWRDRFHRSACRRISRRAVWERQESEMGDGGAQPGKTQIGPRCDRRAGGYAADRGGLG